MAINLTLNSLDSLENETSALNTLNANFAAIVAALAHALSMDGEAPNQMGAPLDLNGNRIFNIPAPALPTDLMRLQDAVAGPPGPTGPQGPAGNGTGDMLKANNLSDLPSKPTAVTNLGLTIGTNTQAYSAVLTALAALSPTTFGKSLLSLANASALQALLTLGGAALLNVGTAAGTVAAGNDSRFWNMPITTKNANYTFVATDVGGLFYANTATPYAWTLPPSVFTVGDTINVRATIGAGTITITQGAGVTLSKAGFTTTGNVALSAGGLATLVMEAANTWVITGAGYS